MVEVFVLFSISQAIYPFLLEIKLFSPFFAFMDDLIKSNKFVTDKGCRLLLVYLLLFDSSPYVVVISLHLKITGIAI